LSEKKYNWEGTEVSGRIILKWVLESRICGMDWIDLAWDRGQWRALANTVMNLQVL
jgi:hypothetical protein